MRRYQLSLRCASAPEVRALRDQVETGAVFLPGVGGVEQNALVEVRVTLPSGATALLTGTAAPGTAGVGVAIEPVTPAARLAIDREAGETEVPTRRKGIHEPDTVRTTLEELPPEAFRSETPAATPPLPSPPGWAPKQPPKPPPIPAVAKPQPPPPAASPPPPAPTAKLPVRPAESGEALLDQGRTLEALAAFKKRAKDPNDRAALAGIEVAEGLLARERGDRFEAAQRFEAALEIDPLNERAAHALGEIRRQVTDQRLAGLSKLLDRDKAR